MVIHGTACQCSQGIKSLDMRGVDEGVFNVLGSLPDDSSRMDALRRLSGAQWTAVPSGQAVQVRASPGGHAGGFGGVCCTGGRGGGEGPLRGRLDMQRAARSQLGMCVMRGSLLAPLLREGAEVGSPCPPSNARPLISPPFRLRPPPRPVPRHPPPPFFAPSQERLKTLLERGTKELLQVRPLTHLVTKPPAPRP